MVGKGEIAHFEQFHLYPRCFHKAFLAPLAKGQRAIVMGLCPSCAVRPSIWPSVCLAVRPCVRASVISSFKKTSPQKLLTGFLQNFTGMFLRWSSYKFLQIIVFYEEFWLPWQLK